MKTRSTALSTVLALCLISGEAHAQLSGFVSNAGSCASQGAWTQSALEQANAISETVTRLQEDPNCKGLANALTGYKFQDADSTSQEAQASNRAESLTQELHSLRTVLGKNPTTAGIVNPILAQATLDSMTKIPGASGGQPTPAGQLMKSRYRLAAGRGLDMLNTMFTTLPSYEKCMQNRPDLAASLFVGGVRMAAAFSSGGQGISPKFASTIGNFLNYLQDAKFAAISKRLNQQKFWSEISCLIETTQTSYCSVQDGFELLRSQKQQAAKTFRGTPIEGYYIMSREVPEVSNWIRKIQVGTEPRLTTDAQFKKDTWTSIVRLINDTNDLPAIYFENYNTVYKNLSSLEQKQNNIRELLSKLTSTMSGDANRGSNFFVQTVNQAMIPFFLLGRDQVPREIIAAGAAKIQVDDYLLDLDLASELKNPDEAMNRILVRLRELMERAMVTGAEYFRSRMSVDQLNLVDESITSSAISSRRALLNIRTYLKSLFVRLQTRRDSQALLPSILDTMSRIDRILRQFDMLDREAQKLKLSIRAGGYSLDDLSGYEGSRRKQMTSLFENVVMAIYLEFNILLQRDGFFTTRIGTYVRHDYFARAQNEDFSRYTNQLLTTAGNNILDRLREIQKFNVAEAEADLSNANVINMENLDQLENLVIGHVQNYLVDLNRRAGHSFRMVNDPSLLRMVIPQKSTWFAAKQDRNNEAENVRAKVCIQTLGFKRFRHFVYLCMGAKLRATLTAGDGRKGLPLEYDYTKLLKQRLSGDSFMNKITDSALMPASNRFSQVCVLRDYYRNNLVAWMTKEFSRRP